MAEICKTGASDVCYIQSNRIKIFSSLLTVKPITQVILTVDKCFKCYPCINTKSAAIKVAGRRVVMIRALSDKQSKQNKAYSSFLLHLRVPLNTDVIHPFHLRYLFSLLGLLSLLTSSSTLSLFSSTLKAAVKLLQFLHSRALEL